MELWWKITGYSRIRVTAADPASALRKLSRFTRLDNIRQRSELTFEADVRRGHEIPALAQMTQAGNTAEVIFRGGLPRRLAVLRRYWIVSGLLTAMLLGMLYLPGRVLFIQVEGNSAVPARMILEAAAQNGLRFGTRRAEIRSEALKNRLLQALPELSWVGVNTRGCVATVSVREREQAPEAGPDRYGSIVALRDAVVSSVTVTAGTALCEVGQAVKAGQVLISGVTDLGICTRLSQAVGEVYGLTRRDCTAVLPDTQRIRGNETGSRTRVAVIFGKNRINFYSDSGILDTTCGRMRMVYRLSLPGGWELPVALVVETDTVFEQSVAHRDADAASQWLEQAALRAVGDAMLAGQVNRADTSQSHVNGVFRLDGVYQCAELIGRRSERVLIKGDGN